MTRVPLLVLCAAALAAQPCRLPPLSGSRTYPGLAESRFCAPAKLPVRNGSAQVLFDDSGSMRGYQSILPALALWSEQALSQVRQYGMEWTKTRGCYFSKARPLNSCATPKLAPYSFRGAASTTLNQAIDSAEQHDLTLIFTDGAGASGDGVGDCATGVDAACVARAMARSLMPRPGDPQGAGGGIWLIPLVATYDGPLYTEQPLDITRFDGEAITQRVSSETAANARIRDPKRDANGLVYYNYHGPRAFLAMVLARNVIVGRAFVAALVARMQFAQIQTLDSVRAYQSGLTAMRPIEIFPGASAPAAFVRSRVLEPVCLTLDARFQAPAKLWITCANQRDDAVVRLDAQVDPPSSDCVSIMQLPQLSAELRMPADAKLIRDFSWGGSMADPARPLSLSMTLSCSKNWPLAKGKCQAAAWELGRDFPATAAALVATKPLSPALTLIQSLSASEVASVPHRIFQLQETLEKFYRNAQSLTPAGGARELAHVDLCRP